MATEQTTTITTGTVIGFLLGIGVLYGTVWVIGKAWKQSTN